MRTRKVQLYFMCAARQQLRISVHVANILATQWGMGRGGPCKKIHVIQFDYHVESVVAVSHTVWA